MGHGKYSHATGRAPQCTTGPLTGTNYYTKEARCKHDVLSGQRGEEKAGPRILTRAARGARGDKGPGWERSSDDCERDDGRLRARQRTNECAQVLPLRKGYLGDIVGHRPSTRREGIASLSLDGLVRNADTLQSLPDRSHCPPVLPTGPRARRRNACNYVDCSHSAGIGWGWVRGASGGGFLGDTAEGAKPFPGQLSCAWKGKPFPGPLK